MPAARLPQSEKERLKALLDYDILDTGFEQVYDELTELASSICETPISLVSLVDENRQWFKSIVGIEARETPRDWAFCAHAILDQEEVLHVPDATKDPRFSDNPLVKEAPNIRLYAGVPLVNPAGHALGTLCVIDDKPRGLNDDQLKALRTLARQVVDQLELRRSLRLLKEHSDELKEANQRKDRLFSIVAHDLRNPLGGIVTLTDSLRRDFKSLDPEAGTELAEEIYQSGRQALDLFNNLHDWARNETGLNQPAMKSMDLREVGQKAHDLLGSFATKKKIVILLEDDGELMVKVDPNMMSSLVQNLLTNAIKFSNPGQEIRLCLSRNKSEAVLQVIDQGVGIANDQIDSLFEIAGVSSTKGTDGEVGSGLGLLLCRQFAEAMGGQLEASSKLGKGSTFTLTLPLIEE